MVVGYILVYKTEFDEILTRTLVEDAISYPAPATITSDNVETLGYETILINRHPGKDVFKKWQGSPVLKVKVSTPHTKEIQNASEFLTSLESSVSKCRLFFATINDLVDKAQSN